MSLSKKQFDVLCTLEKSKKNLSQREIARRTGFSVGTVNKILTEFTSKGWVSEGFVTPLGLEALEPYRVKRAVIIAAGFGSRMVPITLNTPKPLVRVHGKRIIDSLLDALKDAEIPEIYIVRGYLGEQFDQLVAIYPNIKFIENPGYNEANNISSVVCAGELVKNAYIVEADLLISNPELITKYQYESNYLGIPMEKSDDWCFATENGVIKKLTIGGVDCHQMVGISYWTDEDGAKLARDAKAVFEAPGGKERYWDQVALEYCIKNYCVHVRECTCDDIVEIDTFKELVVIDPSYKID
ncbi:MAG: winged helix-turn-helix transcriptional regulator [Ruminococcaceae bacterium]|nr:winged helix-turn-helix transcriptional regulator [Oscillospiraceae bacterium]